MREDFYDEYYRIEDRHWWFIGRRRLFLKVLDSILAGGPPAAPRRILDVGCGTGTMLGYLARYGEATGIDADRSAINYCLKRGVNRVHHTPSIPWPFEDGRFDVVTMLDVLEHMDDDAGALAEVRRVLAPGGRLLLATPAYMFLWGNQDVISNHRRRYTAGQLATGLRNAGYAVRLTTYFNTILFPPIAAIRLLRRLWPAPETVESDFRVADRSAVNRLLAWVFSLEARVVPRVRLPFGVSILAVAESPPANT